MNIQYLVKKNRIIRRFFPDHIIDPGLLMELVELARISASAQNLQLLKYIFSTHHHKNEPIFSFLKWAGYLEIWPGPMQGERPSAYIIALGDTMISNNFDCDLGIASQSILLGAREKGLAGCMIASVNRKKLNEFLNIPEELKILLVIALGKLKENVKIEPVGSDNSIRYFRDNNGIHHVPRRSLSTIIVKRF